MPVFVYKTLTPAQWAAMTPSQWATFLVDAGSASSSCGLAFDPHGRQGIGVAQPQSGLDYPLLAPSSDIAFLLADFYLAYDEPAYYDRSMLPFEGPFRIKWIYGLGCEPSTKPADVPEPVNMVDLVVVDADDRVVFDSTVATRFFEREWGDRLHIFEWQTDTAVCRLVAHTKWADTLGEPYPRDYQTHIEPDSAVLDERTIERMPARVLSLTVLLDEITGPVEFVEGYNMQLAAAETLTSPGHRFRPQLTFAAIPGAGLGIFPGCEPDPRPVRTLNGVGPTEGGDVFLAATDCYFVRQPTSLTSTLPRRTRPNVTMSPGNTTDDDLPDAAAGTTTSAAGWPVSDAYAHLLLGNDCGACCTCQDYIDLAEYMNAIGANYQGMGEDVEEIRNLYHANRDRWNDAQLCFHRRPLRVLLQPQICPYIDFAFMFCNQSEECVEALEISVTFETLPSGGSGELVPGFGITTGHGQRVAGRRLRKTESKYDLAGAWPTYSGFWDSVDPFGSVSYRGRLAFPPCGGAGCGDDFEPYVISATVTATANGVPIEVATADGSSTEVVSEVSDATLNCPAVEADTIDITGCVPPFGTDDCPSSSSSGA